MPGFVKTDTQLGENEVLAESKKTMKVHRCLVLNATYEPLHVVTARRGLILVIKGKASVLKEHDGAFMPTSGRAFPLPSKIVLKEIVKHTHSPHKIPAKLTHKNLWIRDDYTCQYCGRHRDEFKNGEKLTVDHVTPKDLGGRHKWTNVVAACSKCNNRKANLTLPQLRAKGYTEFELKKSPYAPTVAEIKSRLGEFNELY